MVLKSSAGDSPSSPVTITVSSGGRRRSMGLTSPISRPPISNNPNSPLSKNRRSSISGGGGSRVQTTSHVEESREKPDRSFISGTIFTGGLNSVTRGHVIDFSAPDPPPSKSVLVCWMRGCDEKAVTKGKCECGFKICQDCYLDCVGSNGGGNCPGCKDPYKDLDDYEENDYNYYDEEDEEEDQALPLPKLDKRLSLVKSTKRMSHPPEFDHTRWLFEDQRDLWVWLLIVFRLAALGLFLTWRIRHPNRHAMWLWAMSVTCELWFALSWILDQLYKLCPVNRVTDLSVLKERFESPNLRNPKGRSDLPGIDVFVSTADPEKEPPLVTSNTILSILAVDYPVEKLACYLSDDGGLKREYDEFKVRINSLPESIRRRSDAYNAHEELRAKKKQMETGGDNPAADSVKVAKATWMSDGSHWPGTWASGEADHSRGDHAGSFRLPMLVYVSREKRPGYDHNKKAGAMNALTLREGMCFMLDRGGDKICYVQFPQRFEGIDPSDRYANHNTVFFDVSMRALDGLQGPMYVGTGCIFRRTALYGFSPPRTTEHHGWFGRRKIKLLLRKPKSLRKKKKDEDDDEISLQINDDENDDGEIESLLLPKRFGNSTSLTSSIPVAEYQGRLLQELQVHGRPAGSLAVPREPLDAATVAEAISVISCFYEDKTEWGKRVGWIYGSVTEDVVTGYRMHNRGWRSIYCVTKRDAFRGTAPINLTDRLHQVLRWATGSVEIFFSRNNALFASHRMKFLQRVAYFNAGMYPFTSFFLIIYCVLPALSLFSGQFIVASLNVTFLIYLLAITLTLCMLALLEIKWSGITLHDWWRNEQFWLIGGTSAHPAAVLQGLLKVIAGVDISFTLTSKSSAAEEGGEDEFADLYEVKWSFLMVPPITIMMLNMIAIAVGVARTLYSPFPQWSRLVGGVFFSFWVLSHLYPFAKGLMGRRGKVPTIIYVWSGLLSIIISLLWVYISPPSGGAHQDFDSSSFQFP
ncbi:unnamed protein product [Linum tenue]|uniref:Cellulose synthase-like protein D5 n=1 Tax=Linum tenue TaxID=586396 RepID=A0AAV0R4J3_9ROSI|nr:unnamed protein product [Linum tenue]